MGIIAFQSLLKYGLLSVAIPTTIYLGLLGLVIAVPGLQTHVFYLHRVTLTWFKDLNVPETFGFLHNQVTPFSIATEDGETLHAWHILPLTLYRRHQDELLAEPSGLTRDFPSRTAFRLLRDDAEARLIIYLHGTAGCLASGWRPDSYRALYSGAPDKIHIVTVDYRGYGLSSGMPSEEGLLLDAVALTHWAMHVAGIPASRIVIFAQSLGTAVAISLARHLAIQSPPISFAGMVLVASFSDVSTLTGTYRIGGVVPVLSPLSLAPPLLAYFNGFLQSTWLSKDRIAELVKRSESEESGENYHITFIHAQDDTDIPYIHTEVLFWHAVNATTPTGISYEDLEQEKALKRTDLGPGGWFIDWRTKKGVIREQILTYGVHDKLMAYPAIGMAVLRAFQAADPTFSE
jgi:abhydrolase domain-containing protein 12